MSANRSIFAKIFGDELGSIIQVILGIFVLMSLFFIFPQIFIKITTISQQKDKYKTIIADSKTTTKSIYMNLVAYDSLTKDIEVKINKELLNEKKLINNKREILIQCQKNFDSIYLTPQQLNILSSIKTDDKEISFIQWISSSNQWYNIIVSFLISLFFYYIGRQNGKKQKMLP